MVDNECPECAYGSIDLALTGDGRWKIEWYPVEVYRAPANTLISALARLPSDGAGQRAEPSIQPQNSRKHCSHACSCRDQSNLCTKDVCAMCSAILAVGRSVITWVAVPTLTGSCSQSATPGPRRDATMMHRCLLARFTCQANAGRYPCPQRRAAALDCQSIVRWLTVPSFRVSLGVRQCATPGRVPVQLVEYEQDGSWHGFRRTFPGARHTLSI